MAGLASVAARQSGLMNSIGKAALNAKYPDEFDYYLAALELVSGRTGKTLLNFVFPLFPQYNDINKNFPYQTIITAGGVTVLRTSLFTPKQISISGTFGRGLRVVFQNSAIDLVNVWRSKQPFGAKAFSALSSFDDSIKTGFGCIQLLEGILEESQLVDNDGPRLLYYYDLSSNSRYVVQPANFRKSQDLSSNMVWNYNLALEAVAPLSAMQTRKQQDRITYRLMGQGLAQNAGSSLLRALKL